MLKSKNKNHDFKRIHMSNQVAILKEENKKFIMANESLLNSNSWKKTKFLRKFKDYFSKDK